MKRYRIKVIMLHMIAFAAGYTSLFECYPFSIAFFAAAYVSDRIRYSLFPVIILGMTLTASVGQVFSYGAAMLLLLLVSGILEGKNKKPGRWREGVLACCSLLVVAWARGDSLLFAFGEGMLVLALSVLFSCLLESFLITPGRDEENVIIHGPGRQRLEESAEVFERLAGCFREMPKKQEHFLARDRERMSRRMSEQFCSGCSKCLECWEQNYYDTMTTTSDLFAVLEETGSVGPEQVTGRMSTQCIRLRSYLRAMSEVMEQARNNLFWYNRLIENREAVAGQLTEMAHMMTAVAADIYDVSDAEDVSVADKSKRVLQQKHIAVKKVSVSNKKDGKQELFVTMRTRGGRCISTREIAKCLSPVVGVSLVPHRESRRVVTGEDSTVRFVEDTSFRVLSGVARAIKPGQSVSGDNFSFLQTEDGQAVACLSDGMGTGSEACRESQMVVELLEHFLEAGFQKETAVRMINSTMALADGEPNCSTIDLCTIDLYDGVAEFVKLGAAGTFIRRDHWVEWIQSTSLPVGVDSQIAPDACSRKLFDGDFVVLISDGVLEAVGEADAEPFMEEILLAQTSSHPKEIANGILAEVLGRCGYHPPDDMTVLVLGIWKK